MTYQYINLEHLPNPHFVSLRRLDMEAIANGMWQDYCGVGFFWNHQYRFPCRDLSPSKRKQLLRELVAAELDPSGVSIEHNEIMNKYNRWISKSQ